LKNCRIVLTFTIQVDEIAQVDGIDVLFVGPFDLGNNIGHPVRGEFDQELKDAIKNVQDAAKKAGKKTGIYCPNGQVARQYAEAGFNMVRFPKITSSKC